MCCPNTASSMSQWLCSRTLPSKVTNTAAAWCWLPCLLQRRGLVVFTESSSELKRRSGFGLGEIILLFPGPLRVELQGCLSLAPTLSLPKVLTGQGAPPATPPGAPLTIFLPRIAPAASCRLQTQHCPVKAAWFSFISSFVYNPGKKSIFLTRRCSICLKCFFFLSI